MEADQEKIEEFFKKKEVYTNIRDAYKNKGIFIDNFGNKILADRIQDDIPQNYPLDVFCVNQFGINGVISQLKQYSPKDLYYINVQNIGKKEFVIPGGTAPIKHLTLLYDNDLRLRRLGSDENDEYDIALDYDDNYLVVHKKSEDTSAECCWNMVVYQKNDKGDYKKQYEFKINRDDIFNVDNHVLGIIDEKFYCCGKKNDQILIFNKKGILEKTINLPKKIKKTPKTIRAFFTEIKTRYKEKLQLYKKKLRLKDRQQDMHPVNAWFGGFQPQVADVIQEVLSEYTKPEKQIQDLDLSKKNKKLVEKFIKESRQRNSGKNIDPETQYNINLAKSQKVKYNKDEYNFDTNKYKPQIRNITRDVEKNKWLTNEGWQASK